VNKQEPMTMNELLALPVSVRIPDAARALGIGKSTAYEQAATGTLSGVPVKRLGAGYRVNRADLFRELGLDPAMVRAPEADAKGAA
jgi:Helix-turn-helix domain